MPAMAGPRKIPVRRLETGCPARLSLQNHRLPRYSAHAPRNIDPLELFLPPPLGGEVLAFTQTLLLRPYYYY